MRGPIHEGGPEVGSDVKLSLCGLELNPVFEAGVAHALDNRRHHERPEGRTEDRPRRVKKVICPRMSQKRPHLNWVRQRSRFCPSRLTLKYVSPER